MTTRLLPFPATSRRTALLAAAVALLVAAPLHAAPDYFSLAGVRADGFQKWIDKAQDMGYRPININGFSVGDHVEFAGVAIKDPDGLPWKAEYGLTAREYDSAMDRYDDKGYRPIAVSGYPDPDGIRFAAVWVKDDKTIQWQERRNLTTAQYDSAVKANAVKNLVPMVVTGYTDPNGQTRFTVLFNDRVNSRAPWENRRDLTWQQMRDQMKDWHDREFEAVSLSAYDTPDGPRFTATAVQPGEKNRRRPWEARLDMGGDKYQQLFDKYGADGYRPVAICAYRDGGEVRYAAVWRVPRK